MGKSIGRKWIEINGNYTRVPNIVTDDIDLSSNARHVYTLMVRHAFWNKPRSGGIDLVLQTKVKVEQLAVLMDCGKRSVSRYIKELEDKMLIDRARRLGQSSLTTIFDPVTVYGTASPSGHVWHDDEPPVAPSDATNGTRKEQDVRVQDIPEQQPHAARASAPENDETATAGKESVEEVPPLDETAFECPSPVKKVAELRSGAKRFGRLSQKLNSKLTTKSEAKIGVPADALGIDPGDRSTARDLWWEFQRLVTETYSGYTPPGNPTGREIANCKMLLKEYDPDDIFGLFEMVISRWAVVTEKWPTVAKTPTPTFYAAFTLRRDLVPLVQSGKGLTSRTHRVDSRIEMPEHGWGDE